MIGPVGLDGSELLQGRLVRMAEAVVGAQGDDGQLRANSLQERRGEG